jgi:hypothetical protein
MLSFIRLLLLSSILSSNVCVIILIFVKYLHPGKLWYIEIR